MKKKSFVGAWKLISGEVRDADNKVFDLFGSDFVGYQMHTAEGYFCFHMKVNRMPEGLGAEYWEAVGGNVLSSFGRYTVEGNVITYHVRFNSTVKLLGDGTVDHGFKVTGDTLELTAVYDLSSCKAARIRAIWQRIND